MQFGLRFQELALHYNKNDFSYLQYAQPENHLIHKAKQCKAIHPCPDKSYYSEIANETELSKLPKAGRRI